MANFTEKAIISTFREMLVEMPFDKITVTAIIKKCGISHNTFYYHFQDIYDLLETWLNQELSPYVTRSEEESWQDMSKELFGAWKKNRRMIYHLFNSLSRDELERWVFVSTNDVFVQYVEKEAGDQKIDEDLKLEISNFCRYAFFGYVLRFLWNNMEDDVDASVDRLDRLFKGFVANAIANSVTK